MALREGNVTVKPSVGTPRSLVSRLAQRFGRPHNTTALIVALSRAIGLWEQGAVSTAAPPGSLQLCELTKRLFETWRKGGSWDEARSESELLRMQTEQRDPSPIGLLRDMVLDALGDLGQRLRALARDDLVGPGARTPASPPARARLPARM